MSSRIEISDNPQCLLDNTTDFSQLQSEGLGLKDNYRKIPLIDIIEMYVHKIDNDNDNFSKRLDKLEKREGWIQIAAQVAFGISKQSIETIILRDRYLARFNLDKLNNKEILEIFGEPDKVLKDVSTVLTDYVSVVIYHYSDKKLYFYFDPNEGMRLHEIRIGYVDESFYTVE